MKFWALLATIQSTSRRMSDSCIHFTRPDLSDNWNHCGPPENDSDSSALWLAAIGDMVINYDAGSLILEAGHIQAVMNELGLEGGQTFAYGFHDARLSRQPVERVRK